MILAQHIQQLNRLRKFFAGRMLMLGDQVNTIGYDFGCEVRTVDIHGKPDFLVDLTDPEAWKNLGCFRTVFNLGTLEHIFDAAAAYRNVVKICRQYYVGHHPVAGWEGHGIHVTSPDAILKFFELNGFKVLDAFTTTQEGEPCMGPVRNCGKSITLWFAAEKLESVDVIRFPEDLCL